MAGDNQMDPDELEELSLPVVRGELDYAKANRLFTGSAWTLIPRSRYLGNAVLSFLTKIASGYWHIADSQAGYTVLSLRMLRLLDLDRIYTSYGFPNDMLVHLNVWNARVRDFPSRPIYGVGERSGIKIRRVVPRISWLLWKGFFWRLREKYVIRDFHPLVFFYALGFLMTTVGLRARRGGDGAAHRRPQHPGRDDRARRAAPHLGQPVHAVRDVVRHGVEQGPALGPPASGSSPPAVTYGDSDPLRSESGSDQQSSPGVGPPPVERRVEEQRGECHGRECGGGSGQHAVASKRTAGQGGRDTKLAVAQPRQDRQRNRRENDPDDGLVGV